MGARLGQGAGAYTFRDESVPAGALWYRIRQRDFDGQETVSPVVNVTVAGTVGIYPNPASDRLLLWGNIGNQPVAVFDGLGRRVATSANAAADGIDVGVLPPGQYWVRVGEETLSFIKR